MTAILMPAASHAPFDVPAHGLSMSKQECKVFVGGLSWETSDEKLRAFFENFGTVLEAFVSYDRHTGRPRGFGFVVFEDPAVADKVVSLQHTIDRREVEAKKAVPKEEQPSGRSLDSVNPQRTKKIFVGGLAPSVDESALKGYFEHFGEVEDAVVMYDHDNKRPRGFGFITFSAEEAVEAVFGGGTMQTLHDKPIEIKRAVPRDQMGAQTRGLISSRGGHLASGARAIGSARAVGLNNPGPASYPSAGLANRAFGGLDFSGLNGSVGGQDYPRGSGDLISQMTALSLAANNVNLASLAQSLSQGLAAQGIGSGGSLGSTNYSLGQSSLFQAQPQAHSLPNSGMSPQIQGRLASADSYGLARERSVPSASPGPGSLQKGSLDNAPFASNFSLGPGDASQQQQQQRGSMHIPGSHHLHQQPQPPPQQQQQEHFQHQHSFPSPGRRAPYPGGLPSYQEEQGGKGLGQYSSAFQQELSRPFHGSGSFQRHKDTPLAPEHQWSLSSA